MSGSPPGFIDSNVRLGRLAAGRGPYLESAAALEEALDSMGISGALVYSALARESDARRGNELLMELIRDRPRLVPCWVIVPHRDPIDSLLKELRENGIRAVRLFPSSGHYSIRPWCVGRLAKALAEAGIPVFVDFEGTAWTNDAIDWEGIHALCRAVPDLQLVVCGPTMASPANYTGILEECPHLHLEISELTTPGEIARLVTTGFEKQLLFGSQLPRRHPGAPLQMISDSGVDAKSLAQIAHGNLERLVGAFGNDRKPMMEVERFPGVMDTHVHLGGWNFSAAASGTMEQTVLDMDRCGVDSVVATSLWACFGEVERGNAYVAEATRKFPGRIHGYLTLDPKYDDEVGRQLELHGESPGFRGIKLHTQTHGVRVFDSRCRRILEFADARQWPVLVHEEFDVSHWEGVCRDYPRANFILAHVGGCGPDHAGIEELAGLCRKVRNFYFDIASTRNYWGFLEQLVIWAGADRILYGSDYPLMDFGFELGQVVRGSLSREDKMRILSLNARRLFAL